MKTRSKKLKIILISLWNRTRIFKLMCFFIDLIGIKIKRLLYNHRTTILIMLLIKKVNEIVEFVVSGSRKKQRRIFLKNRICQKSQFLEVEFRFPVGLRSRKEQALPTTIHVLNFYPNPANEVVYITAHVPDGAERVTLEVINAQGQPIANLNALSSRGLVEFNIKHLASGVYLCNLYYDEVKVATEKFTVVH
ncbi:MAG: T9SS type A sorting domain-containing protein [Cryomorphaceae bacterium]|nr:T9SS type A sorting domain-containing protein [Cryomorphaceae bacterium]